MDIWLIAATAATGYIAKQLQNVTKGKDKILVLESSSEDVKPESPPRCLLSRFARVKKKNENMISDGENPEAHRVDVPPSTSDENLDHHSDSLSGLVPEFPETEHGNWKTIDTDLNSSSRQRRFLRRNQRYRRLTKPLSSLESCLMSRFQGEQMAMEDYMSSPFPSPVSRPLLVTDGSRVISKSTADFLWPSQHTILSEEKAANSCRSLGLKSLVERGVGIEKTKSRKHGKVLAIFIL